MPEDDDEEILAPRLWSWVCAAGAVSNFVGNVGRAVTALADDLAEMAAKHTAVQWSRDDLAASAQRDLEFLPTTDE